MLLSSGLGQEYFKCLRKVGIYVGKTVDWDDTTRSFKLRTRPFKLTLVMCVFLFCCQNWHVSTRPDSESSVVDAVGISFAAIYLLDALYTLEMIRNKEVVEKFIAALTSFEEMYCKNGKGLTYGEKRKLKSAKRTCSIMAKVAHGPIGFALGITAALLPKTLMNVLSYPPGSILLAYMELALGTFLPSRMTWILIKLVIVNVNCYVYTVLYAWGVALSIQILVGCSSMGVAISFFKRCLDKVEGECEAGKLETLTGSYVQKYQKTLSMYREIQLLSSYYNTANCYILVAMLTAAVVGQVVSAMGLINRDPNGSADPAIDFFILNFNVQGMILCVLCLNFIFGSCGNVYENSNECIDFLKHSEVLRKSKLLRRIVTSMPHVKINFGKTNFVERLSSVNYQQFTNEKIIDALLLQK